MGLGPETFARLTFATSGVAAFWVALEGEFPHVDFSEVADGADEMWEHKEVEPDGMNSTACGARAGRLLAWLWRRREGEAWRCLGSSSSRP